MASSTPPNTQPAINRGLVLAPQSDAYSPAEETTHRSIGDSFTIPQAVAGGEILPPAAWAEYIKNLPWKVARTGKTGNPKTAAIRLLVGAESQREPTQRSSTGYTGKRLDERVGANAANVDSILTQVVGCMSPQECTSCLKGQGPWAHCVRFHDPDRTVTACGNCQWNGKKQRCDFYQLPVGGEVTQGHRRGEPSTSTGSQGVVLGVNTEVAANRRRLLEELREATQRLQARVTMDYVKLGAIREMMERNDSPDIIPSIQALLPTTTAEDIKAEFDTLIAMVGELLRMERGM